MKPSTCKLLLTSLAFLFATLVHGQETWTAISSPTTQNLWSACYGGGQFVAVGENSAVVTSPDGLAWVPRAVPSAGYWLVGVAQGAGIWVIVGDRGLIMTSTDLVNWTTRASGTSSRINGVAYGGGRWMAVAESGELLTSTNAITWTKLKPSSDRLHGIVFAYGQFVITGDNGLVRTTIDATDYAEKILPGSNFLEAVNYARRTFVAIGEAGFAVSSFDGVNWDTLRMGSAAHFRGIGYFNNQFIAAGTDGTILTSTDPAATWIQRRSGSTALLTSLAASDSSAVVVGFGGAILRSAPAASAPIFLTSPSNLTDVVGSNVLFQATASGSLPLAYQWYFNGQPIASATSDRLVLAGVKTEQAGTYSVRLTNALGSATSGSATLRLVVSAEPGSIVDPTFVPRLTMPNGIAAAVEQSDGKIIIGGSQFFVTAGVSPFALARLNRDGSIDSSFAIGSGLNSGGSVSQLALQPDGNILVAGAFESINGIPRAKLARLNQDGSVDVTFAAAPTRVTAAPAKIVLQADGKVLVLVNSTLLRLRLDGSEDTSFAPVAALDFGPLTTKGIAIIGTDKTLRRVTADGAPESTLIQYSVPGYTSASIFEPNQLKSPDSLLSSSDGRVYGLSSYPVTIGELGSQYAIVELDGGTAPFFKLFYGGITSLASYNYLPTSGGTVMVAVNSRASSGIKSEDRTGAVYRYTASRSLDTSFNSRTGADKPISGLFAMRDGGVLATGSFTAFDGAPRPNLVRLVAANALEAVAPVLVSTTPEAAVVLPGTAVRMNVVAAGTASLTYQWTVRALYGPGGIAAQGATPSLAFVPTNPGVYIASITVTNRAGTVTGAPIRITVADSVPVIVDPPTAATALSGRSTTLFGTVAGTQPITYEWFKNGTLVGSDSFLTITRASAASEGDYTLVATNSLGRTVSAPARLTVDGSARLVNISTRTEISPERPLIAGFVITGAPGQRVLVRGIGPGLAAFGLTGTLPDPAISLIDSSGRVVATNDNFGSGPSSATAGGVVDGVGAFRLTSGLDSALVASLSPGAYTVQLSDTASRSGVGLLEVYRADDSTSRLVNLSSRGFVGAGMSLAIAGIAVEGERPRQFLIRGIGPTLREFGVADALADPVINLTSAVGESLFRNDDWGSAANAAELASTSSRLGAFPLATGSKDAAMLVTLAPGNYTALLSGAGDTSGTALIEIYEVP